MTLYIKQTTDISTWEFDVEESIVKTLEILDRIEEFDHFFSIIPNTLYCFKDMSRTEA